MYAQEVVQWRLPLADLKACGEGVIAQMEGKEGEYAQRHHARRQGQKEGQSLHRVPSYQVSPGPYKQDGQYHVGGVVPAVYGPEEPTVTASATAVGTSHHTPPDLSPTIRLTESPRASRVKGMTTRWA